MTEKDLRIGVVGLPGRWSSEALADAVAERTGFRALCDPAQLVLDLDTGLARHGDLILNELDALIVKKIAADYTPAAVDRMAILQYLAHLGLRIYSRPDAMLPLLNRLTGTLRLMQAGIPMPETVITEDLDEATRAVERFERAVAKPLFTSKARGMVVLTAGDDVRARLQDFQQAGNQIIYLQRMIDLPDRDLGVTFLGGEYLATYARVREHGSWNTTTRSGGKYAAHEPSAAVRKVAERAERVCGLEFTCVDVVETDAGPLVFEVSAFGGFRGLEACDLDAAACYAEHVIGRVARG